MTTRTETINGSASEGLYRTAFEHDACGVGMICSIRNEASRQIVLDGLQILCNLEHRGAVGADPDQVPGQITVVVEVRHDRGLGGFGSQ